VTYRQHGDFVLINRHGAGVPLPPHAINHRANIRALGRSGLPEVLSLNSVVRSRRNCPPARCLVQRLRWPPAGTGDLLRHGAQGRAPGIANNLIPFLVEKLAPEFEIKTSKVYVQMRGPRFETKAEIRIIRTGATLSA